MFLRQFVFGLCSATGIIIIASTAAMNGIIDWSLAGVGLALLSLNLCQFVAGNRRDIAPQKLTTTLTEAK